MNDIPAAFVFHAVDLSPELAALAAPCPVCREPVGAEGGTMLLGQAIALAFSIHVSCVRTALDAQYDNIQAARRARDPRRN